MGIFGRYAMGTPLMLALALGAANAWAAGEGAGGDDAFWKRFEDALNRSPLTRIDRASVDATEARREIARSRLLPTVEWQSSVDSTRSMSGAGASGSSDASTTTHEIELRQSVVDPSSWSAYSAANLASEQSRVTSMATRQETARAMLAACAALVSARDQLASAIELEGAAKEQMESLRRRAKVGERAPTDFKQAAMQASSFTARRLGYEVAVARATEQYEALFGETPPEVMSLPALDEWTDRVAAVPVEQLVKSHPLNRAAIAGVAAAEKAVAASDWKHYPTLGLSAGVRQSATTEMEPTRQNTVSLNLSVPIYSGGMVAAEAFESRSELAIARARSQDESRRVAARITSYKTRAAIAAKSVAESENARQLAQEVLTATQAEFKLGAGSQSVIFDALENAHAQKIAAVNARIDAWSARVDFLWAAGKLDRRLLASQEDSR